jgi:hypothetical protein
VLRFDAGALRGEEVVLQAYHKSRSLLQVLTAREAFCMQPMQHCPADPDLGLCPYKDRAYFCPKAFGPDFDPSKKVDLSDFGKVHGTMLAYLPKSTEWDEPWLPVNISRGASAFEIVADLAPLRGAPIHAVRYAWGVKTADTGPEESMWCCDDGDPLVYTTKPCRQGACPIVASGGLPANPFLARIVGGRCQCIPPQVCH